MEVLLPQMHGSIAYFHPPERRIQTIVLKRHLKRPTFPHKGTFMSVPHQILACAVLMNSRVKRIRGC